MLRCSIQLLTLVFGFGLSGWGLSSFGVPLLVWLSTGLVIVYLIWVGKGGIFPASVWITLLISLSVGFDIFPTFWPQDLHYRHWARGLMLIWAAAVAGAWLLGRYGEALGQYPPRQRQTVRLLTLGAMAVGLRLGQIVHQLSGLG
ncbi:hypothetical protein C7271_11660 [filamentous cyanobacterium CCP5]|nr:hypothetical protein C7271_11660 [filamentous cyanobacterium CCP5]